MLDLVDTVTVGVIAGVFGILMLEFWMKLRARAYIGHLLAQFLEGDPEKTKATVQNLLSLFATVDKDGKLAFTPAGEQLAGFLLSLGLALLSKTRFGALLGGGQAPVGPNGEVDANLVLLGALEKLPKKWQGLAQAGVGLALKFGGGLTGEGSSTGATGSAPRPGGPVLRP